jgi:hypothetical protein
MKAKVLNTFVDKSTKKLHVTGTIVSYDDERFNELSKKGFIAEIDDDAGKAESKKAGKGVEPPASQ